VQEEEQEQKQDPELRLIHGGHIKKSVSACKKVKVVKVPPWAQCPLEKALATFHFKARHLEGDGLSLPHRITFD